MSSVDSKIGQARRMEREDTGGRQFQPTGPEKCETAGSVR